jgi:hypothetical protein
MAVRGLIGGERSKRLCRSTAEEVGEVCYGASLEAGKGGTNLKMDEQRRRCTT